jgi:hypothetical protein
VKSPWRVIVAEVDRCDATLFDLSPDTVETAGSEVIETDVIRPLEKAIPANVVEDLATIGLRELNPLVRLTIEQVPANDSPWGPFAVGTLDELRHLDVVIRIVRQGQLVPLSPNDGIRSNRMNAPADSPSAKLVKQMLQTAFLGRLALSQI